MPSSRSATNELLRVLHATEQPFYVLDGDRRIVFLNQACASWLGHSPSELLGRASRYSSGNSDPLAAAADALCPPPEVFQGQRVTGAIALQERDGQAERRRAEFIPFWGDNDSCAGVLVLVDNETLSETSAATGHELHDEAQYLHDVVLKFRQEMAQWHPIDRLIGQSPAMFRVRSQVKLAAGNTDAVLIVGPRGIGRQHVGRTIHFAGATSNAELLPILCPAMPGDLLRDAMRKWNMRRGAVNATVATLLLMDVHLLTVDLQSEIAQWLAAGPPQVRVIATALEPLDALARRGEYREDLAALLSTLVIDLPALAERRNDIPTLAQMLLEDLNAQGGKQLRGFAPAALDRMVEYDWPGQIDELNTMVREAYERAEGVEVTTADLPKRLYFAAEAVRYPRMPAEPIDLEKFLAQVETELIERALARTKGNKSEAVRLLGLNRPRLYRRMVQLGLDREDSESSE